MFFYYLIIQCYYFRFYLLLIFLDFIMPSLMDIKRRVTKLNFEIKNLKKQILDDLNNENILDITKLNYISANITTIPIDLHIKILQDGINSIEYLQTLLRKESTRRIYASKINSLERKNVIIMKRKMKRMEKEEDNYIQNENPYKATSSQESIE